MPTIIHKQEVDINNRLLEIGLDEASLRDVVKFGQLAWSNCTANHPPLIPGIWAWGETVRALREYVLQKGWRRSDLQNYSLVIDPTGKMAIAVATGDEGTGRAEANPCTKAPKGPSTHDAVNANQAQLNFNFLEAKPEEETATPITWLLLMYRDDREVRSELSLPYSIDYDGRINGWQERILLTAIPLDGEPIEITPPSSPDIVVDVKRKA